MPSRSAPFSASLIALSVALVSPHVAYAQDSDVLVMRRGLINVKDRKAEDKLIPVEGADLNSYHWETSTWYASGGCQAAGSEERAVGCVYQGEMVADSFCPQPKPEDTRGATDYSQCEYAWHKTSFGEWDNTCSPNATRTVTATCLRSDNVEMPADYCYEPLRPVTQKGANYSGCSYAWEIGAWDEWAPKCSTKSTRTREVECYRSDGIESNKCSQPAPSTSEVVSNFANCTVAWDVDPFWRDANEGACTSGPVDQVRNVQCKSVHDGKLLTVIDDVNCEQPAPDKTRTIESNCSFDWNVGSWGNWSQTCGTNSVRNRTVTCVRDGHTKVSDANCVSDKPATQEAGEMNPACAVDEELTGEWVIEPWSDWSSTCSANATRTKEATCVDIISREEVAESNCPAPNPSRTETAEVLTSCSVWDSGAWSNWSSTCSASATRTRDVSCITASGDPAPASSCDITKKPGSTESSAITSGCEDKWILGAWKNTAETCGPATRERTYNCQRTYDDGTSAFVSNGECNAVAPTPLTITEDYIDNRGCTSSWATGAFVPEDTCSTSQTSTRTVACELRNVDGTKTVVDDAYCAQIKPSTTLVTADYSQCTYEWIAQPWGPYNDYCTTSANRSRTANCHRIDGSQTVMGNNFNQDATRLCGSIPANMPLSENGVVVVTGCESEVINGGFEEGLLAWNQFYWNGGSTSSNASNFIRTTSQYYRSPGNSLHVNANGYYVEAFQIVSLPYAGNYNVTLYSYNDGTTSGNLFIKNGGSTILSQPIGQGTRDKWTLHSFNFKITAPSDNLYVSLGVSNSRFYVDDVKVTYTGF